MDLKPKMGRILLYTARALAWLGLCGWVWAMWIWYEYWNLPTSPNPATGNIYPLNIHGYVVYQTLQEQVRRQRWEFWSLAAVCCGMALGAVYKFIFEKPGTPGL